MKPFISYSLGNTSHRYTLLYLCIVFFHIGAMGILIGKTADPIIQKQMFINSMIVFVVITFSRWMLKLWYRKEQLILWHIVFFLLDVGYIMLERLNHELATKQIGHIILGIVIALIVPNIFKRLIKPKYYKLYFIATLFFIFLPFIFGETRNGAMNWVQIGPIGFQPSEFGKVAFLMYLAAYFDRFEQQKNKKVKFFKSVAVLGIVLIGLVLQRDLGGALLYFLTYLVIVYVGTKSMWIPFIGIVGGVVGSFVGYTLFSHVRVRVEAWIDPFADISGSGYQVVQGLFAMGTWGWLGSGLTRGIPQQIPIVATDYIFAAIGEELGNGFAIVVLICYLGIILQGLKVALVQKDSFECMVTTGIVTLFGIQTLIIVGGVLKLIPLTGITLPFVSYGGSSMLVSLSMIGLLTFLLGSALKKNKKGDDPDEA